MQKNSKEYLREALIQAADDDDLESAKQLISAGADVNGMPFIMACQAPAPLVLAEMIAAGADLNQYFAHTTPLIRAVESRYPNIVRLLVDAGADVNLKDENGLTPLMASQRSGRRGATEAETQEIINILTQAGAS